MSIVTHRFLPDRQTPDVRSLETSSGLLHRPRIDECSDCISHGLRDIEELTAE
jgi:hypothetical protein